MARRAEFDPFGHAALARESAAELDLSVERVTGIEPAFSAWEADVLPLNYTRRTGHAGVAHSSNRPLGLRLPTAVVRNADGPDPDVGQEEIECGLREITWWHVLVPFASASGC